MVLDHEAAISKGMGEKVCINTVQAALISFDYGAQIPLSTLPDGSDCITGARQGSLVDQKIISKQLVKKVWVVMVQCWHAACIRLASSHARAW
ncbi:hypothetical protein LY622_05535 [Halomonas sp. M5N1S17]|uniref:hypothetical protein n=1 Tax=Halomonas alkalisoli TaxID=2907158 RepID=UPI001F385FA8|nr:hypothetical protein [Halomonas alkalisoli]MCE9662896.1 hypothetical protein [Halomonas alkalisoli]